jgi:transcriptional regulator with XRE-family HTH domain
METPTMTNTGSIGERIKQLRTERVPRLTQRELAEAAGISVDLISKLEQGTKQSALLVTLHKIARALDSDISALVSRPVDVDVRTDDNENSGLLGIRRAITTVDEDEPATEDELQKSATLAWGNYWSNRFDSLTGILPQFIGASSATVRETGSPAAYTALSDAYGIAASMLVHLNNVDLGYVAMERAISAAEHTDDALRRSALHGWMSWILMHHTESIDTARLLAIREAESIEPKISNAPPEQISVWGALLCRAATVAAREDNASEADDIVSLAEVAATRLHGMGWSRSLYNQAPFGLPLVIMRTTEIAVITDRPGRALAIADRMPPDADMTLAEKARHLADRAFAYTELGKVREAETTLYTIRRLAPKWMTYQSYPRFIVAELWEREKRARSAGLRELAEWLHVPIN